MQEPSYSEVLHNCIIFQTVECMSTVPGILIAVLFFDVPAADIVYMAKNSDVSFASISDISGLNFKSLIELSCITKHSFIDKYHYSYIAVVVVCIQLQTLQYLRSVISRYLGAMKEHITA